MFDLVRHLFHIIVHLQEERIAVYSKREKIRQLQHRKVKVCTLCIISLSSSHFIFVSSFAAGPLALVWLSQIWDFLVPCF